MLVRNIEGVVKLAPNNNHVSIKRHKDNNCGYIFIDIVTKDDDHMNMVSTVAILVSIS